MIGFTWAFRLGPYVWDVKFMTDISKMSEEVPEELVEAMLKAKGIIPDEDDVQRVPMGFHGTQKPKPQGPPRDSKGRFIKKRGDHD